jgi:hypothetical protein
VTSDPASGVSIEEFATAYPVLFHLAQGGSWPSIERHGLLCTTALLDLFEIAGSARNTIERAHRPQSVTIEHPEHGSVVIRDQKPMSEKRLVGALIDGTQPPEWYALLNGFVFFWPTLARLERMRGAYEGQRQTIITIDTLELLTRHAPKIRLSAINSGATRPMAFPRGRSTFMSMTDFPFAARRRSGKASAVAEVLVEGGVLDINEIAVSVEDVSPEGASRTIWKRAR